MCTVLNEEGLHCTLSRKHRVRRTTWIGRRQRSQERKSIHLLATALGEPKSEKRSSFGPCSLLLQGNHIFHIYCKQAELENTVSLLRVKQACWVFTQSSFHSLHKSMPRSKSFPLHSNCGRNYGASPAGHCPPLPLHLLLSLSVYKNCKPGNRNLYFSFTTIWYCESMTHSQGS